LPFFSLSIDGMKREIIDLFFVYSLDRRHASKSDRFSTLDRMQGAKVNRKPEGTGHVMGQKRSVWTGERGKRTQSL